MQAEEAKWMNVALEEAHASHERGDLGVGAVLVRAGELIVRGGNRVHSSGDLTAHAEMVAIRQLQPQARHGRGELVLYATFEPCPMCAGAALCAGVTRIVVGGRRVITDRTWGDYCLVSYGRFTADGHWEVQYGVLEARCIAVRGSATGTGEPSIGMRHCDPP